MSDSKLSFVARWFTRSSQTPSWHLHPWRRDSQLLIAIRIFGRSSDDRMSQLSWWKSPAIELGGWLIDGKIARDSINKKASYLWKNWEWFIKRSPMLIIRTQDTSVRPHHDIPGIPRLTNQWVALRVARWVLDDGWWEKVHGSLILLLCLLTVNASFCKSRFWCLVNINYVSKCNLSSY